MQSNTPEDLRSRLHVTTASQFLSAFCYSIFTSIIVAGIWTIWTFLAFCICVTICRKLSANRPNLLILRRFGRPETEEFLSGAAGGLSGYAQPIWLMDLRAEPWIRRNLPGALLYYTRPFAWICIGFAISGKGNHSYFETFAWISWMVIGTCSYHRYVAGALPTAWISCCTAAMLVTAMLMVDLLPKLSAGINSWADVVALCLYFAVTWVLGAILLQLKLFRTPFSSMYMRRVMLTSKDVNIFSDELRNIPIWRRFTTIAQLQVLQVICDSTVWAEAVYETLSASSIALADVTDISVDASLVWELEQCRNASVPVVLTCEEGSIPNAMMALAERGFPKESIFPWQNSNGGLGSVSFSPEGFSKHFMDCVREHLAAELAYRPRRMSRDEALIKLAKIRSRPIVESISAQA